MINPKSLLSLLSVKYPPFQRWVSLILILPALALGASMPTGAAGTAEQPTVCSAQPAQATPASRPTSLGWQALPNGGLQGYVFAMLAVGNDLYVGGSFTQTADGAVPNLGGIARLGCGVWHALPNHGFNGVATAFAVIGSDLYVGGSFTQTADGGVTNLNGIARLSNGTWNPLANGGLNSDVRGLAAHSGDLYVGGFFDQSADGAVKDLNGIAKYSSGAWSALPNKGFQTFFGLHCCFVDTFAFSGNDLYVGGIFTGTADGAVQNLYNMARLSGGMWSAPNSGLIYRPVLGSYGAVYNLLSIGSDLYAAGIFTETGDAQVQHLNSVARFSGATWSNLAHNGLNTIGFLGGGALAARGFELYVGGGFTHTADNQVQNLNHIAQFSGGAWSPLPDNGLNGYVDAIAFSGNDLYAAGYFTETADGAVQNLNAIAVLSLPPLANYPLFLPLVSR